MNNNQPTAINETNDQLTTATQEIQVAARKGSAGELLPGTLSLDGSTVTLTGGQGALFTAPASSLTVKKELTTLYIWADKQVYVADLDLGKVGKGKLDGTTLAGIGATAAVGSIAAVPLGAIGAVDMAKAARDNKAELQRWYDLLVAAGAKGKSLGKKYALLFVGGTVAAILITFMLVGLFFANEDKKIPSANDSPATSSVETEQPSLQQRDRAAEIKMSQDTIKAAVAESGVDAAEFAEALGDYPYPILLSISYLKDSKTAGYRIAKWTEDPAGVVYRYKKAGVWKDVKIDDSQRVDMMCSTVKADSEIVAAFKGERCLAAPYETGKESVYEII